MVRVIVIVVVMVLRVARCMQPVGREQIDGETQGGHGQRASS